MHPETTDNPSQPGSSVTPERLQALLAIARTHGVSYLATGDVVIKMAPTAAGAPAVGGFGEQAEAALQGRLPHTPTQENLTARAAREDSQGDALHKAARAIETERAAHQLSAEAKRQAEKPVPDPWDAWRNQKAPEMFESEVTNRG